MKQFNFDINSKKKISNMLDKLQEWLVKNPSYSSMLFHIYSAQISEHIITKTQNHIHEAFPDACICGTSTNGNIYNGQLSTNGMIISVSIFDSTNTAVHLLECNPGEEAAIGHNLNEIIEATDDIVAAEILITLKTINSHTILKELEKCAKKVTFFGGGSANFEISQTNTKVFNHSEVRSNGVILVTYSGKDFHIDIHHAIGWKPLGKEFKVTKIRDKHLYELDNIPAGKIYSKYLDIHGDDNFFINILEFPIMTSQHGQDVLRMPFSYVSEDDSIILAADIDLGATVHLSYGDPGVIQSEVKQVANIARKFEPQAIFLYSCGIRRIYWQYLINKETTPFSEIAPTAGFYSSGEIMGIDDYIIEHHVTLVAISMREGDGALVVGSTDNYEALPMTEEQKIHNQISMLHRLANFINVTSAELMEANEKLKEIAETDELTGVYNRRMLNRLVEDAIHKANKYNIKLIIGIIDIDDFKEVNDTYGHSAGDLVLKTIANAIYSEIDKLPSGLFGRWGGEEFLFIAPTLELDKVFDKFEDARKRICSIEFEGIGKKTVSIGVTDFILGDTVESIFSRADAALYEAKNTGKDKICRK